MNPRGARSSFDRALKIFQGTDVTDTYTSAQMAAQDRIFREKGPVLIVTGRGKFRRVLTPAEWNISETAPAEIPKTIHTVRGASRPNPEGRKIVAERAVTQPPRALEPIPPSRGYPDPEEIAPVNPLDFRWVDGKPVLEPGWWK